MDNDSALARVQSLEPAAAAAATTTAASPVAPPTTAKMQDDETDTQSHAPSNEKDLPVADRVAEREKDHPDESTKTEPKADENTEYITGIKLLIVMSSVALTCFVMLLDTSIISTVSIKRADHGQEFGS